MNDTPEQLIQITVEGEVSEVVINRPKALNALSREVLQALLIALQKLEQNPNVRVIILTGAGERAFVAGADVASMSTLNRAEIADYAELGQRTMRAIECASVPVIAAVNGFALGGGLELALACDIIVAASTAKVGQPEVNLGIIPGFGGSQRLIERCGIGTARRLVLTGEIISAEEAFALKVVDKVTEPSELMNAARAWGKLIASKGPLAIKAAKQALRGFGQQQLLAGLRREVELFVAVFDTADRAEGMNAFLQKRSPKFSAK